ncbi:MAG: hypothetical protein M1153_02160 [Patescibacteria group bacterium]|nr:hypothetical protein [Patescibacteria group bacterium]
MEYLNQPVWRKEGNFFVLYKADFTTDEKPGFSEHTSVSSGNALEVGRFATLEELQQKSIELFEQKTRKISD